MTPSAFIHAELPAAIRKLRAYAIRMAGIQDADDILQTTALKALENAHQFTPGTSLQAWLHEIMRNEYNGGKRTGRHGGRNNYPKCNLQDAPQSFLARPANQETVVMLRQVVAAVSRLKPVLRGAMTALINNDADAVFGANVTARAHLSKARLALKEMTA